MQDLRDGIQTGLSSEAAKHRADCRVSPSADNKPEFSGSFAEERQSEAWDHGEPLRPDDSVKAAIARFSPKDVPDQVWERIGPVVTAAVAGEAPEKPNIARRHLTIATQLAVWADRIGVSLEHTVLFHPETIDRYIREGCAHLSIGSRMNYRSQLWKFGEAVIGPDHFPPHPLPLRRSPTNIPYSKAEVTGLVAWARGLRTDHMRRNAQALLAIGLGAGLSSQEVSRLAGSDVREEVGLVLVDVIGQRARTVPVLRVWAPRVLELAEESGTDAFFLPGRTRITRGNIDAFIGRCSDHEDAAFNVQRLRITWMVTHLVS